MTAFKTFLWSVFVPGSLTILLPYWLLSTQAELFHLTLHGLRYVGLIPMAAGALLYGWCAWDFTFVGRGTPAPFDPPKELVVKGPYRFVRNPMYVAAVTALFGEAVFFGSATLLAVAAVAFLCFHLWVLVYEEPTLGRKFGESYQRYCRTVARWIPGRPTRVAA